MTVRSDLAIDGERRDRATDTAVRLGGRRAWGIAGLLFLAQIINYFDKSVMGLAATQIMHDLHLSSEQYGLVASSFFSLYALSGLTVGLFVAQRVPSKPLLLVLVLIWSLAQLPIVFFASLGVLVASRVVLGVGEGPGSPTATSVCHEWFASDDRNMPTALLMLGSSLGAVISGPVLVTVMAAHGWRAGFLLCSLLGLAWAAIWAIFGASGPAAGVPAKATRTTMPWRMWTDRTILGCIIVGFCAYWITGFSVAWLAPFVRAGLGFDAAATGWIVSAVSATSSVCLLGISYVSQRLLKAGVRSRLARSGVNVACMGVGAACLLGAALATDATTKLVLLSLGSALPLLTFTLGPSLVSEVVPAAHRSRMLITIFAGITVAGFLAPIVAGRLIGENGLTGYNHALIANAVVVAIGAIAGLLLFRPAESTRRLAVLGGSPVGD